MAQNDVKRLLPIIAKTFAELGYRRATTAVLARHCGVRENVIYRVWPNKKAMFIASIDYIWEFTSATWTRLLEEAPADDAVDRLLRYESTHHGELKLYRIVFAGLTEADDPQIAAALKRMYRNFHAFIASQLTRTRAVSSPNSVPSPRAHADDELLAWALVGMGTVANIGQALGLIGDRRRSLLYTRIGGLLIQPGRRSRRAAPP